MAHREFTTAHVLCRVVLMAGRMVTEWMNDFVVGWKSCFLREMRGIRRGFRCLSLWGCGCSQDSRPAHAYREQMRHPWFVVVSEEDATVFQGRKLGCGVVASLEMNDASLISHTRSAPKILFRMPLFCPIKAHESDVVPDVMIKLFWMCKGIGYIWKDIFFIFGTSS